MDKNGGDEPPTQQWAFAAQASSSLVGPVVLGIILDWALGWTPYATMSGIIVGFFSMIALLVRMVKRSGQ